MNYILLGIIIIVYVFILVALSWYAYRGTKSASDYMVGGRSMNSVVMALSYGATFISASAIVGFGGMAAAFGMGLQWLCLLNMLMGVVVAFIFFGKKTRRLGSALGANTFPQLMGRFFHSRSIEIISAAIIFVGMPIYAAVVMKGGAVFVEEIFHIDYHIALLIFTLIVSVYVITGGMKGVMYTSAFQAILMFVCMFILLMGLYKSLGMGFVEANRALDAMDALVPANLAAAGHQGWAKMPAFNSEQWYTLVTSLILGVGIGCLAQPQLIVRFLTVRSSKQLNQGIFIGCLFLVITVGVVYHSGALSNLYFYQQHGKVAVEMSSDIDKIIPLFINESMPNWFTILLMLCIISASMSTLSSQFHTMGTSVASDIYVDGIKKGQAPKHFTKWIKFGVLVSILISYVVCYMLEESIIARGTAMFMGMCAAAFLPCYFAMLYWKKVTRQGALWSIVSGFISCLFCIVFLHQKEAVALGWCQAIFHKAVLIEAHPFPLIDPLLFSLPLSAFVLVLASLATYEKEARQK